MTNFKLATWNVNSLRVRLPHVLSWLQAEQPDVLALQEIKMPDADFPLDVIRQAGYHATFSGQRTYNGMALLTRVPAQEVVVDMPLLEDPQRRVLAATISGIRIMNLYVPNGESVNSDKYHYKLNWLAKLQDWLSRDMATYPHLIITGDFNIAPHAIDVHDPLQWEGKILCSDKEREALDQLLSLGLHDCFRKHSPDLKAYSWWDYRLNAFKRNLGLRIDHIFASHTLIPHCISCHIDKAPRALERPSDHAPVVAEFTIP